MDQSDALQRVVRAAIRQRQVVQPGGGGTKGVPAPGRDGCGVGLHRRA